MNALGKTKKQGCVSKKSEDWLLMHDTYSSAAADSTLKERRELWSRHYKRSLSMNRNPFHDFCLIAEIQQTYCQNINIFICQTVFMRNLKKKSFEQKSLLKKSLMNVYLALLPVSSFKNLKNICKLDLKRTPKNKTNKQKAQKKLYIEQFDC